MFSSRVTIIPPLVYPYDTRAEEKISPRGDGKFATFGCEKGELPLFSLLAYALPHGRLRVFMFVKKRNI
jgi:hypothetical protein